MLRQRDVGYENSLVSDTSAVKNTNQGNNCLPAHSFEEPLQHDALLTNSL